MRKDDVRTMLYKACQEAGTQTAWARQHGMTLAYVNDVLSGHRDPGKKILTALGLKKVIVYQHEETGK